MVGSRDAAAETWRILLAACDQAMAYRAGLETSRVAPELSPEAMLERLEPLRSVPGDGRSADAVVEELIELARPGLTAMAGPRFFGWVTGGTLPAALAADWMASAWDQNAGPATGAPAACAFEVVAIDWVVELLGLPRETRGALVTGATLANFTALAAARSQVLEAHGWDVERDGLFGAPPIRVLVGRERHDTIDKALRLLGLGKRALRVVDADAQGRMSPVALARELARETGPTIVCAQAGNVNSGAFDPLGEIAAALSEHQSRTGPDGSWLHVDGAFGLWARACPALAHLADGVERADSWATDAHKFLNVPYDAGIVLTRHPRAHRRAMAVHGAYLPSGASSAAPNPGAFTPELSRRARGFVLWAAIRELGRRGLDELVARCARLARLFAGQLALEPGLRVLNDVVLNQIVVRAEPPAGGDSEAFTRDFVLAVQRDGTCYPTPTLWRGSPAVRFSVINATTTETDIERSARAVRAVYSALRASSDAPGSVG